MENPHDLVAIWKPKRGWWKSNRHGYTEDWNEAGLFPRTEAEEICNSPHSPSRIVELEKIDQEQFKI